MSKTVFSIIGGAGWRSEFYLRIAKELPDRFSVGGMLVRDENKGRELEKIWGVKTYSSIDELLEKSDPSFVVVSVPWNAAPGTISELVKREAAVLTETPPAPDLEGLMELNRLTEKGARIQVAEQYMFQPIHSACLSIVESGMLGTVTQAQVSVAHGYHGISMIRKFLGIGFEDAAITAYRFVSPIIAGPDRGGPPGEEKVVESEQIIAILNFDGKLGIYDFCGDQYFSWIRSSRVLLRGEKGEILNDRIKYLKDFNTPVNMEFKRINTGEDGNLEGYYHKGILAGEEWVYKNPFIPARLSDDEIAVATCIEKMSRYVKGGPGFYSLAEASQDHYLGIVIGKALETKDKVMTVQQPWVCKLRE